MDETLRSLRRGVDRPSPVSGGARGRADERTIFLCGDVMTGRGVDQVLPFPSHPELHESYARSALDYVDLAERLNGDIATPVAFDYIWGDALAELDRVAPAARVINLETSITTSDAWEPKGINYRMHPGNLPCLAAARIDCCVLANNHVMDWGPEGLDETLGALRGEGIGTAGAGRGPAEATEPGVVSRGDSRVLVFGFAGPDCGVPKSWAAEDGELGVALLPDYSRASCDDVLDAVRAHRSGGDLVVLSIHWGGNWGYAVPDAHRKFAHRLIDSGAVDVVHGHSSHHPRGLEVHAGKPILYGCGDFLNDYEGISGYEHYRDDLVLMYLVTLDAGELVRLRMVPFRIVRFGLRRATEPDASWLQRTLDRESAPFGTHVRLAEDGSLEVGWD
jgi:poly-gamma-glutamate capsule biosynthesis protein CapA/YwtB (metallophosphatase superfamily)